MDVSLDGPTSVGRALGVGRVTRRRACEQHGHFDEQGLVFRGGVLRWLGCRACAQAAADAEAQQQELKRQQHQQEQRRQAEADTIDAAAIPPRFRSRTFDTFVADTPGRRRALAAAREFVEDFDANLTRGSSLVFLGQPGTGKSHLAASMLLALTPAYIVRYTTCMGMIRAIRDTWRRDSPVSERDVMHNLGSSIELLVVDEVGVQHGTDSERTLLFEVLDRRYCEMRPTVLLSNLQRDELDIYLGERVVDRLRETARVVLFDWPSGRAEFRDA